MAAAPGFAKHPRYEVKISSCPDRVRVSVGDELVAETTEALLIDETGIPTVIYVPLSAVVDGRLVPTDHETYCPFKGTASYWALELASGRIENAVWCYREPYDEVAGLGGYVAFYEERDGRRIEIRRTAA